MSSIHVLYRAQKEPREGHYEWSLCLPIVWLGGFEAGFLTRFAFRQLLVVYDHHPSGKVRVQWGGTCCGPLVHRLNNWFQKLRWNQT